MSFALYLIGFTIFTIGLAFAASRLGVSNFWIGTGVVVLLGLGILTGVSRTRQKDSAQ
jgi:hypothetical protein